MTTFNNDPKLTIAEDLDDDTENLWRLPVEAVTDRLVQPASRWRNLPETGRGESPPFNQQDALIYIRDVGRFTNVDQVKEAAAREWETTKTIEKSYRLSKNNQVETKVLRVNLDAYNMVQEMDQVIRLARTVYTSPLELNDWIGEMFRGRFRRYVLLEDADKMATLGRVLQWADKWAEVRYRFLNHFLRDDPDHWETMGLSELRQAGDNANALVHRSAVEEDCMVAATLWFQKRDRRMYRHVYGLRVKMGARLRAMVDWEDLEKSLRLSFSWCIGFINRYVSWREDKMRRATRDILASAAYRNARGVNGKKTLRVQGMKILQDTMEPATKGYKRFMELLERLIEEALVQQAFCRNTWISLQQAATELRTAVRTSHLTWSNNERNFWPHDPDDWDENFSETPIPPEDHFLVKCPDGFPIGY